MSDEHSTSRIFADFDLGDEDQVGEFISGLLAPSDDPDVIGWLGGYRVQKVVGRGGMGIVSMARPL